jgi:hypothetical protein
MRDTTKVLDLGEMEWNWTMFIRRPVLSAGTGLDCSYDCSDLYEDVHRSIQVHI